ncbi:methyl-accepting chemotaxis protein [Azoarcus sp. L1K30]|uniref:methyl-accepting chemotaxis protein n=1 Tax=Azoarcus sp. L1K30 TaxID=2820277 RepID=UPI0032C24353
MLTVLVAMLGMLGLASFQLFHLRAQMLEDRKVMLRAAVDSAMSAVSGFEARESRGELSREAAQEQARSVLRSMRYLDDQYFYAYDTKGMGVAHPVRPEYEGASHWDRKDKEGTYTVRNLVAAAVDGDGFTSSLTPKPGSDIQIEKLQHLKLFKPWGWVIGTGSYVDDLDAKFFKVARGVLIGAALALVLVGAVAWTIARSIARQIGGEPLTVMQLMGKASAGDLTVDVGHAPAGSMLASLGAMVDSLRGMMRQLGENAHSLVGNAEHIANASNQVAIAARNQSDATANMAAAIEELTVSVTHISDSASETESNSARAAEQAGVGEGTVLDAAREIGEIARSVTGAAERIRSLGVRADEISTIANVIKEIAAQTNLLALNAAIEAARAGEQGRGFAVVADEVRGLAERTASATLKIEEMVGAIQGETASAVKSMDETLPQVERGVTLTRKAADALNAIRGGANETLSRAQEVALATREQSTASTAIAGQVENIAQMVEETSATVGSTADSAKSLEKIALDLKTLISRFRY